MKARITTDNSIPFAAFKDTHIILQAQRPISGNFLKECPDFVGGHFWAAIDPYSPFFNTNYEQNRKLDATQVFLVTEEKLLDVLLNLAGRYKDKYIELCNDGQTEQVIEFLRPKLEGLTVLDAEKLLK